MGCGAILAKLESLPYHLIRFYWTLEVFHNTE
jgi:hypothetical protein